MYKYGIPAKDFHQVKNAYFEYLKSSAKYLTDVYKNPSDSKIEALDYIRKECHDFGGKDLRIIRHGIQFFSCGYIVKSIFNSDIFVYHTPYKRIMICVKTIYDSVPRQTRVNKEISTVSSAVPSVTY